MDYKLIEFMGECPECGAELKITCEQAAMELRIICFKNFENRTINTRDIVVGDLLSRIYYKDDSVMGCFYEIFYPEFKKTISYYLSLWISEDEAVSEAEE